MNLKRRISALLLVFVCVGRLLAQVITLSNATYTTVYDVKKGCPVLVYYILKYNDFAARRKRVTTYFQADSRLPKPRVKDADYRNSGYARGHLCPAADRTATKAMQKETFLMSNVAPMTTVLNSGSWSRYEAKARDLAVKFDSVRIHVGTLFFSADSSYLQSGRVQIPSHFFKEVRRARDGRLLMFFLADQQGHIIEWPFSF